MNPDTYKNACIGATADGAAVNFGKNKGVLTRLRNERPWLLRIHCASHRFELALKESALKQTAFKAIIDLMVALYYYQKASGKFTRHLKSLAETLQVKVNHSLGLMMIAMGVFPFPVLQTPQSSWDKVH